MAVKYTFEGLFIYLAMAAYLSAFLTAITDRKKTARIIYLTGFLAAIIAFVHRWYNVQHIPFQSMFEIFLSMGMLIYPLSIFCRRVLSVGAEAADMLIGAILLFPAGFVFHPELQMLPPALQCRLFVPHVAAYLISYVIMAKAAVQAFCQLKQKTENLNETPVDHEQCTYRVICLGFPFLTLGLVLGSWWAKLAWTDYWGWDPKELWSLASWLIYAGYFQFRYMFGKKYPRINSCIALTGLAAIVITLLWVNLSRIFAGLHNYAS